MIEEITNEIFQRLLRMEMKKLKRNIRKVEDCPNLFRLWDKYKIQLNAIRQLMIEYPEVTNEKWETLIKLNPTSLRFVNNCLATVPGMLNLLKEQGYNEVFDEFYRKKRIVQSAKKTNRGRSKVSSLDNGGENNTEQIDEFNK